MTGGFEPPDQAFAEPGLRPLGYVIGSFGAVRIELTSNGLKARYSPLNFTPSSLPGLASNQRVTGFKGRCLPILATWDRYGRG